MSYSPHSPREARIRSLPISDNNEEAATEALRALAAQVRHQRSPVDRGTIARRFCRLEERLQTMAAAEGMLDS
jgi:hypothetical protein